MMKRELVLYFKSWHQLPKSDLVKGSNNMCFHNRNLIHHVLRQGLKIKSLVGCILFNLLYLFYNGWKVPEVLPGTFPSNNFFSPLICEKFFLKLNS